MDRILQNKDIAWLFGVFRSQRKLVHLMTSSRDYYTTYFLLHLFSLIQTTSLPPGSEIVSRQKDARASSSA